MAMNTNETWVAKQLQGGYPPLTVHSKTVIDSTREKVYIYGGWILGDEGEMPTPNFHVFDARTMTFTDLTKSLTYVAPGKPASKAMRNRKCRSLPSRSQAGLAFLEIRGQPMIFIFGGHDVGNPEGPSSTLIAINMELREWYIVEIEKNDFEAPAPRVRPTLVGVNEKLYIFGGIQKFSDPWVHHRTYSIIEFQPSSRKWKWVAVDVPYPATVPAGKVFGHGIPVYGGLMILLLPGKKQYKPRIQYEKDCFFYFLTKNNTFLQANVKGIPPKSIHWDFAFNYDPTLSAPTGLLPYGSPQKVPSVFICTWLYHRNRNLAPELWEYTLFPKDTFNKLGISNRIYKFRMDFQLFSLIGNRAFIMGWGNQTKSKPSRSVEDKKIKVEEGSMEDEDESTEDEEDTEQEPMCDTFVEIPVQTLLLKAEPED
ncbi:hypothetical protein CPB84DRAFT_1765289 [Gymnopilus junonius]|uniref:Uncharacterized protein n=1 Tax=Gymnopilus junonius TaxID=109634 RepID=A0A9P5NZE5_GYMJU|nr:hypothetical protein CPB84DRAFT_1765289 [Gymnopilus junonius]